jgi:exopolysaccharide production protein ExoQ
MNYPTARAWPPAARASGYPLPHGWVAWITTTMMCVLIILMVTPEDFDYASIGAPMPAAGSATTRLIWLAMLCGGGLVVLRYVRLARLIVGHTNVFFVAFGLLACVSMLWSIDPEFTTRRLIRLTTIFLCTLAFVLVPQRRIQDILRPMLTIMLVGSIALVMFFPDLAIERSASHELVGAWHGLSTQKNGLGSLAAIAMLLWLHAWLTRQASWPSILLGLGVSLLCLLFSRSSTSLLAAAFSAPFMIFLARPPQALRRYMPSLVALFAMGSVLYSLAVLRLVPGSELLLRPLSTLTGKDPSFSGRTAVWDIMTEHIGLRPFLGSGYGAYWTGPTPGAPAYEHVIRLYFYPTEAHNGYLDIINDLGAVGGACLLGYLVAYLRQALRLLALQRLQATLYLGLFFEQLIANLSESRWLNVLCIEFVIMTLATVAIARALLDQRLLQEHRFRYERLAALTRGNFPAA